MGRVGIAVAGGIVDEAQPAKQVLGQDLIPQVGRIHLAVVKPYMLLGAVQLEEEVHATNARPLPVGRPLLRGRCLDLEPGKAPS